MSQHSSSQPSLPEAAGGDDVRLGQVKIMKQSAAADPGAGMAFPGEDRGQSLAEMAQRDLDAALRLLAERAQYITGASGAAIALRREGEHDMLCRASAGTNAPELGALLSAEFGLSGESVRTRQPLRCDDAERDARVNRESCRALGIASVAVMPIVSDGQVLGVFELFAGQANAFGERDVAALQRLAEMVETATRFARAAEEFPRLMGAPERPESRPELRSELQEELGSGRDDAVAPAFEVGAARDCAPSFNPVLWSDGLASAEADACEGGWGEESLPDNGNVPLALRVLRKCEACGFPVSESRRLCLDCEDLEGKSRGRNTVRREHQAAQSDSGKPMAKAGIASATVLQLPLAEDSASERAAPILSAATESSLSWWAANKYILGALVAAGLAIAAVLFLR